MISISQIWHHLAGKALDLLHPLRPARDHELQGEVINPDLAVNIERLHQLLGIAAQVALVLRNCVTRHLNRTAARQPYLLRVRPASVARRRTLSYPALNSPGVIATK